LLVLLSVGLFFAIKIKHVVKGAQYYLFYEETASELVIAEQIAEKVKAKGGAGYVIDLNAQYYVVVNAYNSEERANAVANKNGGKVLKLALPTLEFDAEKQATALKKEYDVIGNYAFSLCEVSYAYDCGRESREGVKAEIEAYEKKIKTEEHPLFELLTVLPENFYEGVKIKFYVCDIIFSAYKYFSQ
jgi:hypothetical protein